ncbi:MAG: SPFH domain-containing protein [Planctomycetota bacterium]
MIEHEPTTTEAPGAADTTTGVDGDPAGRSLAGALHTSFVLLSVIMVVLLATYLLSGAFTVDTNERAVVLRFGRILGKTEAVGGNVLDAGLHFSWPFPIDHVILIPTRERQLTMDAFWHYERPGEAGLTQSEKHPVGPGLRPRYDGSLLTRDQSLVHVKWVVTYQVKRDDASVLNFAENILRSDLQDAEAVVRSAVRDASVRAAVRFDSKAIAGGSRLFRDEARNTAQKILDDLETGLSITNLTLAAHSPPLQTIGAFNAVTAAENESQKMIEAAMQEATSILQGAAGVNWEAIQRAILDYKDDGDDEAYDAIIALLDSPDTTGEAHRVIQHADRDATDVIARARQAYDQFSQYLAAYQKNPDITVSSLWTDAQEAILSEITNVKTFVPGNRPMVLYVDHDPNVWRRIKRLETEQVRRQVRPWETE